MQGKGGSGLSNTADKLAVPALDTAVIIVFNAARIASHRLPLRRRTSRAFQ
jgi:hypothetical protein